MFTTLNAAWAMVNTLAIGDKMITKFVKHPKLQRDRVFCSTQDMAIFLDNELLDHMGQAGIATSVGHGPEGWYVRFVRRG